MKSEPVSGIRKGLDDTLQCRVADLALAVARLVEIHRINHARKLRVVLYDCADRTGELLAKRFRLFFVGHSKATRPLTNIPARFRWKVEADKCVIRLQYL